MFQRTFLIFIAAAIGCTVAFAAHAQTLPYEGTLERDGAAENGTVWMEIAIMRDGYTLPTCWDTPTAAWTVGWLDPVAEPPCYTTMPFEVTPTAGAFAVEIGAECPAEPASTGCGNTTLSGYPWVLGDAAVTLYLRVGPTAEALAELAGGQRLVNRQQLGYAVSNPAADGFVISGVLEVSDGVDDSSYFSGLRRDAGDIFAQDDVFVDDDIMAAAGWIRTGDPSVSVDDGDIVATEDLKADVDLYVGRNAVVDDNLTVGRTLTVEESGTFIRSTSTCSATSDGATCSMRHPLGYTRNRLICVLGRYENSGLGTSAENDGCNINAGGADEWILYAYGGADCEIRCYYW